MTLIPYEPDADDAQGLERAFPEAIEEDFNASNPSYATAKFVYKPMADDLLALKRDGMSDLNYGQQYICGATDAVGDPVRISGNDTVTKADAGSDLNSEVFSFIVHKGTLGSASSNSALTCYVKHFVRITGLSGLTADQPVYLTNAGGYGAQPGSVKKIVGVAINATTALLFADPINAITHLAKSSNGGELTDIKAFLKAVIMVEYFNNRGCLIEELARKHGARSTALSYAQSER